MTLRDELDMGVGQVTFDCECGERVHVPDGEERAECYCGATYAVTITQISGPELTSV